MITRPGLARPAPNRTSAMPAASASLSNVTWQPVRRSKSLRPSVPIQLGSTFAAVSTTPSLITAGKAQTDRVLPLKVFDQLGDRPGDGLGVGWIGSRDPQTLGQEHPAFDVYRCAFDAATADIDAQNRWSYFKCGCHADYSTPRDHRMWWTM